MWFHKKRKRPDRPVIFVCSPYRGDTETNTQNARRYCRLVVEQGGIPFAPHLLFTQFLNEDKAAERRRGLWMGMDAQAVRRAVGVRRADGGNAPGDYSGQAAGHTGVQAGHVRRCGG